MGLIEHMRDMATRDDQRWPWPSLSEQCILCEAMGLGGTFVFREGAWVRPDPRVYRCVGFRSADELLLEAGDGTYVIARADQLQELA